jgi:hypothetical protein
VLRAGTALTPGPSSALRETLRRTSLEERGADAASLKISLEGRTPSQRSMHLFNLVMMRCKCSSTSLSKQKSPPHPRPLFRTTRNASADKPEGEGSRCYSLKIALERRTPSQRSMHLFNLVMMRCKCSSNLSPNKKSPGTSPGFSKLSLLVCEP